MFETIEQAQTEIPRAEETIQQAKKFIQQHRQLTDVQQLAIQLHKSQCGWNHDDGCGWYYEMENGVHNWQGSEHTSWLGRAKKLIADMDGADAAMKAVKAFNNI